MGIDTITGFNGTAVVLTQGFSDELTLNELALLGLTFDENLTVTVNVSDDDLALFVESSEAEASLMLTDASAQTLRDMGIDFINADNVVIDLWNDFDLPT
jgi:hypothetical protein